MTEEKKEEKKEEPKFEPIEKVPEKPLIPEEKEEEEEEEEEEEIKKSIFDNKLVKYSIIGGIIGIGILLFYTFFKLRKGISDNPELPIIKTEEEIATGEIENVETGNTSFSEPESESTTT